MTRSVCPLKTMSPQVTLPIGTARRNILSKQCRKINRTWHKILKPTTKLLSVESFWIFKQGLDGHPTSNVVSIWCLVDSELAATRVGVGQRSSADSEAAKKHQCGVHSEPGKKIQLGWGAKLKNKEVTIAEK